MTDLFRAGVSLLGASVVLKMTKNMSDRLTEEKEQPKRENKKRYFRL